MPIYKSGNLQNKTPLVPPNSPAGRALHGLAYPILEPVRQATKIPEYARAAGHWAVTDPATEPQEDISMPTPPPAPGMFQPYPAPPPKHPDPVGMLSKTTLPDITGEQRPFEASYDKVNHPLNTESALSGLKEAQSGANFSNNDTFGEHGLPTWETEEELRTHAYGDPNAMAPGASQRAGGILDERAGNHAYAQSQERAQTKMAMDAIAGLHPAVQQEAEEKAVRGTYPGQVAAQGAQDAAELNRRGDVGVAEANAGADNSKSSRDMMTEVIKQISAMDQIPSPSTEQIKARDAYRQILTLMKMGKFDVFGQ